MASALPPGAHAIIATFAEDGPVRCSGLPVERYSPESLAALLGDRFRLLACRREQHQTPGGKSQAFIYGCFQRL
jgi:hypothetical protein